MQHFERPQTAAKRILGFTLIEVMVASIIFSLVSIMGYTSLGVLIKQAENFRDSSKRFQHLEETLQIIRADMMYLANRPALDSKNIKQYPYVVRESRQDYYFIEFTRSNVPMSGLRYTSNLRRVAYKIENEKLIRDTWAVLDQPPNSLPISRELIGGIKDIKVESYLDNKWVDVWSQRKMPKLIRWTIEFEEYGEIEIVIPGVDSI